MAVYKLIKLKRDYSANWTLRNPILSLGEPGYERDTGKLKIGDGVTPWVGLEYIKVDMNDVVIDPDDLADVLNDVLQGGFGIDIVYSDPSDTILIRTTGLATQSDLVALSGDVANLDSALIFRGITDPTQPNSAPTSPAPANGDMWISNAEGNIDGTWVNLSGQEVVVDQFMLYEEDANGWVLGGNAVGIDLSNYVTQGEFNNLEFTVNQNSNNISINYLDIQTNIVDIQNLQNAKNNQQTQINALIQATGHIHDQDIYQIFNDLIILGNAISGVDSRSIARDDNLQAQINAISGAIPPEVDLSVISGYVAANTASGVVVLGKADQNSADIVTLSGLIDGGLDFKGYTNPTATGSAPSLPINGDLWVSDSSGVIDNGWTCIGGQDVGVNQWMIYSDDDTCWQLGPATDIDLSAYALKTELDAVSGLIDQNATDIITISGLVGSGIPSGLVEYSTGLAIRHGSTEVSVNEVSGNSVIDLTNWKIKDGHFIPNSNANFDLGNAEYKVRHLFLSDNSIYMGSGKLSSQGNDNPVLLWEGEPLAKITDINTIISGELAEQKLLDLQDVTSNGPVEQYSVPVYDQGSLEYKVRRLTPLEVEDTSTPPLGGYPVGSLGNQLTGMQGDIQSNTILISGIAEDIVEIPDAVIFKGVTDPTVSGSAPAGPDNGDMWVSNNSGLIDGSWTGLSGEDVVQNQFLLYSTGLSVWLKGGKIDVNDLSDQYLPLTGNLNPNDQKLDAVEFTSNVVTTSISGLHPHDYPSMGIPGLVGNLTYVNHPSQPSATSAQVYGPSEFNIDRSDYSRDWKEGIGYGFDCVSIGYQNEDTPEAGYSWSIQVGPPSRYFPSGVYNNGNTYQQNRYRDPNPKGWNPAFIAQRAAVRGQGAFEFRPLMMAASQDMTTAPYQVGFKSTPQNQIEFYKVYANDPGSTPTYIGFHSVPFQQVFAGPSGSSTKGYALHVDFKAGEEYQPFDGIGHGRVYGFFADMSNKGGANVAGFIERGAEFNQLQAPTVFGADTIYGGSNPFDSGNIYKPTDQIDIVQGGLRIRNGKLVQESTDGNPGQIGWDQNGLLCYTSSSWKRAPLLRFATTVTNPTPDSVALTVDGNAKLTATANDLQAFAGYVPQTDNSLVTVGTLTSGLIPTEATLPISSADDRVTLSSPSGGMFKLTADSKDKLQVTEDDVVVYQTRGNTNVMTFQADRDSGNTGQNCQFRYISSYADKSDGYFGWYGPKGYWRFSLSETAGTDTITIDPSRDRIGFAQTNNEDVFISSPTGNVFTVEMGASNIPVEKFRITADDIQMFAGYVPLTDQSLVTKGSMEDGTVKAKLPIAGTDGTVTLFGANNIFSVFNAGSESFIISADQHIGLGKTPASNVLLDGDTDQAFVYRFKSTNTGLYNGRFGTRIESSEYTDFIVDTVVDPQEQTYGLWGGNSGGSSPIIAGSYGADILIRSTGPAANQFIKFDLPVISGQTGANMVIPAGNSVGANLLVGGRGENPKSSFTICAKAGGSSVTNPQSVVWASHMDGDQYSGSAYFKLAHGDDGNDNQKSYWNLSASTPTDITDASGVYERTDYLFRIDGTVQKSTDTGAADPTLNYMVFVESTDTNHCKVQINRNVEFLSNVSGINIGNLDDVEFPVGPNPVAADQILRYSTINNKWVNSNAGSAVLGNAPLGGWAAGSVGEAIANAGGGAAKLPVTSDDGLISIEQHSSVAARLDIRVSGSAIATFQDDYILGWGQYLGGGAGGYGASQPAISFAGADDCGLFLTTPATVKTVNIGTDGQARLAINNTNIEAFSGYVPSTDQSLVTKKFLTVSNLDDVEYPVGPSPVAANQILVFSDINNKWVPNNAGVSTLGNAPLGGWPAGSVGEAIDSAGVAATLPITNSGNTAGIDFSTGGIHPATYMYSRDDATNVAGSLCVDKFGRARLNSYADDTTSVAENGAFSSYTKVDKGSTRTGFSLRATYWGDPTVNDPDNNVYQTINYLYGYYSNPLVRDTNVLNSADFFAVGTQCLDNSSVNAQIGFFVGAGYASQAVPPSGQDKVTKFGFRSDLPQVQDSAFNDKNFHIFTNGTAPSRFGSDVELAGNGRIVNASYYKDAQLEAFNSSIRISSTGLTYLPTNAGRINNNSIFQIENSKEDTDYVGMSFYNRNVGGTSFSAGIGVRANANGVEGDSTFTITCREGGTSAIQTAAFSNDKVDIFKPLIVDGNICAKIFTSKANNPGTKTTPGDASVKFNDRVNFRSTNLYQFVPISGSVQNVLNFYDSEIEDQVNVFLGTYGSNYTGDTQMGIGPEGAILHSTTGILALGSFNVDSKVVIGCGNSSGLIGGPTLTIERDDIYLRAGMIPQTDQSLATKKYVDDATGGGAANVQQGFIVATGTQTDFTVTQGYTSGQMDVYLNGVKMLDNTDYTAGDGSTIVLEAPAVSGDIVQVTTYTNLTSLSLTTDDITVPATSGSSFAMNNGGVTQTDLNSDFDTRISLTSVCTLADMDCGFFGGDNSVQQPSNNPLGYVLATKQGTSHTDANGASVYEYNTKADIPDNKPNPNPDAFYLADGNIYYTWDGSAFVNDPSKQPTLPINLSYEWGTVGAYGLKMGSRILGNINGADGPQDRVAGTLQSVLDSLDMRLQTAEGLIGADSGGIDPNVPTSIAVQVQDNTNQVAANETDIATNASNITTLQGSANTLPVNGTNTVQIAQNGTNKKIDIKTDTIVRASVSDTQAQFNVPVNLASSAKFTPASENAGSVGDITFDDDFIWVRTTDGWKKSPLYTFDATPAVSIRITQQAYQNLVTANTVDPNITYIIIG